MNKDNAINNVKIKIISIDWYVPHYTPLTTQQNILTNQIVNKTPIDLQYVERSVFMKDVKTQIFWTCELGTQEGINIPIWTILGSQQSDRQHGQNSNKDTFYRPPVTSAQCIIGSEKYPVLAILKNYNDNGFSQVYSQIRAVFRAPTKDDIPKPYVTENDFRSSNDDINIGYNL